ncbi:MAG: tetratricopeptide repeat protein [Pseudomonadota bacterium]|nr:tetratricopeptide repeat protein [Pseudomonadota bacterium]
MTRMPDIEALNHALRSADWPLAERLLRQLLALQPRDPGIHYNLGLVLWRRGDLKGAEAMLRATLGLSADHQNARFELASLLMEHGGLVEAIRLLDDYVTAVPRDGDG